MHKQNISIFVFLLVVIVLLSSEISAESDYKTYEPLPDDDNFVYVGKEKDTTKLNYYGGRYYDPKLRGFTQPDQRIQDVYNPQDLNRYAYVRNNPYKYVDPSGEIAVPAAAVYTVAETAIDLGSLAYSLRLAVGNPESAVYQAAVLADVADIAYGPFSNPGPSGYTLIGVSKQVGKKVTTSAGVTILADIEEKLKSRKSTQQTDSGASIVRLGQEQETDSTKEDILNPISRLDRLRQTNRLRREGVSSIAIGRGFDGRDEMTRKLIMFAQGRDCGESCARAAFARQGRRSGVRAAQEKLIEQGRG